MSVLLDEIKIGLSDSDKATMSATIKAAVLALVADDYSTSATYAVGDLVVKDLALYRCKTAITTAESWTAAHWESKRIDQVVETAIESIAIKLSKGDYDGSTGVGYSDVANNLTPYSDDSGDDQTEPFILQGTGCGNGTEQVDTGSYCQLKEKRGNTVVVNQWIKNGNFANGDYWAPSGVTLGISDNVGTITSSGSDYSRLVQYVDIVAGHKYLLVCSAKSNSVTSILLNGAGAWYNETISSSWKKIFGISTAASSQSNWEVVFGFGVSSSGDTIDLKDIALIDLTQWFGSNEAIPSDLLTHPENFFRYYQGSLAYNAGTLVNSNGQIVKTIGRNVWDEVVEVGSIDGSGNTISGTSAIHSKNPIRVSPNTDYYFKVGTGGYLVIDWFDKDGNNVGYLFGYDRNEVYKSPSTAVSMKFAVVSGYGTTYNHDITISLYYSGESGYDQYYPYEVLDEVDTGSEVLRSAGSAHDVKKPSGEIVRNVGVVANLGSLGWALHENVAHLFTVYNVLTSAKYPIDNYTIANIRCALYIAYYWHQIESANLQIALSNDGSLRIRDDSCDTADELKAKLANIPLYYELAEPTTEQGTPHQEAIKIHDFGQMEIGTPSGTTFNGVPMGNEIFYPVDYKAFVDTLYNHVGGDGNNVVPLKGEDESLSNDDPHTMAQAVALIKSILPTYPTTDGIYHIKLTVADGVGTLDWEADE